MTEGDLHIRSAVHEDLAVIAASIREEDETEIIASGFENTEEALEHSFENSSAAYCLEGPDGIPLAVFGVVPQGGLHTGRACVWMLGTTEISKKKKSFAKLSKPMIAQLLGLYPVLSNIFDARYYKTIRWLRWCGAKFGEPYPLGINRELFRKFEIRRS